MVIGKILSVAVDGIFYSFFFFLSGSNCGGFFRPSVEPIFELYTEGSYGIILQHKPFGVFKSFGRDT